MPVSTVKERQKSVAQDRLNQLIIQDFVKEDMDNLIQDFDRWLAKSIKKNEKIVYGDKSLWNILLEKVEHYKKPVLWLGASLGAAIGIGSAAALATFGIVLLPIALPLVAIGTAFAATASINAIGSIKILGQTLDLSRYAARTSLGFAAANLVTATATAVSLPVTGPVVIGAALAGTIGYNAGNQLDVMVLHPLGSRLKTAIKWGLDKLDLLKGLFNKLPAPKATLDIRKFFSRNTVKNFLFNGNVPKDLSLDSIRQAIQFHLPKLNGEEKALAREADKLTTEITTQRAKETAYIVEINSDKNTIAHKQDALRVVLLKARSKVEQPGPAKDHSRAQTIKLIENLEQSKECELQHKQLCRTMADEATGMIRDYNSGMRSWLSLSSWSTWAQNIVLEGGVACNDTVQMQHDMSLIAQAWSITPKEEREAFVKENKGTLLKEVSDYEKTERNWIENSAITPSLKEKAHQDLKDSLKLWQAWINKDVDFIKELNEAGSNFDLGALEKVWGATKVTHYFIHNQMKHRAHSIYFNTLDDMEDGLADLDQDDLQAYCELEKHLFGLETRVFDMECELGKAETMARRLEAVQARQSAVGDKITKVEAIARMLPRLVAEMNEPNTVVVKESTVDLVLRASQQNRLLSQHNLSRQQDRNQLVAGEVTQPKIRQFRLS